MKASRTILADDHLLIRAGIRALFETLPEHELIAECSDGNEAVDAIRELSPDVILLDIAMPGPSGIEVTRSIRQFNAKIRILILSSIDRPEIIEQGMTAGANGYLLKDFVIGELLEALNTVLIGQTYLSPRIRDYTTLPYSKPGHAEETQLTSRQREVLRLVASGKTTKEIARDLGISPKTVEFHRGRLMERIGANDVTGLTRYAVQSGVLR